MDELQWLIAREIPHLHRYALALLRNTDAADDLVQDCLERALRKQQLWRRQGSMRSWLFRMLYNVFLNTRNTRLARGRETLRALRASSSTAQQ
jgi:RNA polymerase sigma-70 factor, ECF subfamily